ncbi:hypothetical protein [Actinoplanes sp. NPDC089786]|uniref:hypothetical protein n=1 Tax=Actinoplanes sp. NPDC089786 TaxID=3155185 RepID=UPI003441A654
MQNHVSRRAVLAGATGLAVTVPAAGPALATAYAGFRVVRQKAGLPSVPEITLPAGYTLMTGTQYQAASRAEYLCFVQGEADPAGIRVSVRWPDVPVKDVIAGERHLALEREVDDRFRVTFTLPVYRASATADSPTVQVWSYLGQPASGLYWHVEHNDPDRAAGVWPTVAWPSGEVIAVQSWMAATREVLVDSGLVAEAQRRSHFFALMGFETNNPLHPDNPPHWHMSYYPGPTMGAAKATVPHYWVDALGRTFYNGQDVQGGGRTPYRVDQPAPIYDAEGALVITTTIRAGGGLDLDPPNGPAYSIIAAVGQDFTGRLKILKGGRPWRSVATRDNVRQGKARMDVRGTDFHSRTDYTYDPLTGITR